MPQGPACLMQESGCTGDKGATPGMGRTPLQANDLECPVENQTTMLSAVIGPPRSDRTTCPDLSEIWRQAERASARSV
jgi:hypothetical protein